MADGLHVSRSVDGGLEVESLFVGRAFNRYQAGVQAKHLVAFSVAVGAADPMGSLTFAGQGDLWAIPVTGAFGGVAAPAVLPAAATFALVEAATEWLRAENAGATARLAPECFPDPNRATVENALFRAGWRLKAVDLNYHLPVVAPAAFVATLGETKQKELRRLRRSGAVARRFAAAEAKSVHNVIAANRAARGFPMTMGWAALADLAVAFPDRVSFHGVERGAELLAGAICLQVSARYAYVFYWGEHPDFRKESPVTLLAEHLMADCHAHGVCVLDLGTSTDASAPNPGLIAFKESLGCATTAKRTYALDPGALADRGDL